MEPSHSATVTEGTCCGSHSEDTKSSSTGVKVFVLNPMFSLLNRLTGNKVNTDNAYLSRMLPQLSQFHPIAFSYNYRVDYGCIEDCRRLLRRISVVRRLAPRSILKSKRRFDCNLPSYIDVIYGYGCGVTNKTSIPLIYHNTFCKFWLDHSVRVDWAETQLQVDSAQIVTTWTDFSAEAFSERFPTQVHKLRTIPPFLPHLRKCIIDPANKQYLRKDESIRFVFVGNDAKRKGLPRIVAAWAMLNAVEKKRASLTVCSSFSDGPVRLPDEVEHRGFEPDVPQLLKECDVLISAPSEESYGFVFTEAACASCVVVAPDDGTRRSMLAKEGTVFVDPLSVNDILAAIRKLIDERHSLPSMQKKQFEFAMATYDPALVANQYLHLFNEAQAA
jgi:glycosyltransferase involved in cell wall biosynthesis